MKILLNILVMTTLNINAQDLERYKWGNRLVLIFAENESQGVYKDQLKEFISSEKGLHDRKILIYHIFPEKYKIGLNHESKWEKADESFKKFNNNDSQFRVVLIGLDGGIKLEQNKIITLEKLFSIIDKMPMRRIEIENKNK